MNEENNCLPNVDQPIPKLIWQTSKTDPHKKSLPLIKSWIDQNPDYQWQFMDDVRCDRFIQENFTEEFYHMYRSLPLGVMRADVWRVAVVYAYGGIYADTDCECVVPVSHWLDSRHRLVVAVEVEGGDLLNFAFAAQARHPALLSVLNRFLELYQDPRFMQDANTPVQNFGQYGFSDGILRYFSMNSREQMALGGTTNYYNENPLVQAADAEFLLYQHQRFTNNKYSSSYIAHDVASLRWRSNYQSWRQEQKNYLNETR